AVLGLTLGLTFMCGVLVGNTAILGDQDGSAWTAAGVPRGGRPIPRSSGDRRVIQWATGSGTPPEPSARAGSIDACRRAGRIRPGARGARGRAGRPAGAAGRRCRG